MKGLAHPDRCLQLPTVLVTVHPGGWRAVGQPCLRSDIQAARTEGPGCCAKFYHLWICVYILILQSVSGLPHWVIFPDELWNHVDQDLELILLRLRVELRKTHSSWRPHHTGVRAPLFRFWCLFLRKTLTFFDLLVASDRNDCSPHFLRIPGPSASGTAPLPGFPWSPALPPQLDLCMSEWFRAWSWVTPPTVPTALSPTDFRLPALF